MIGYPGNQREILSNLTFSHLEIDSVDPLTDRNFAASRSSSAANRYFNLAFTFIYIHDAIVGQVFCNLDGITFAHDYFARNRSTTYCHSDGLIFKSDPQNGVSANNLSLYNSVFEDIEGTASIVCLWGRCTNWNIFKTLVFFDNGKPHDIYARSAGQNQ